MNLLTTTMQKAMRFELPKSHTNCMAAKKSFASFR